MSEHQRRRQRLPPRLKLLLWELATGTAAILIWWLIQRLRN